MIDLYDVLDSGRIETANYGVFEIVCVLVSIDYPKCFICKNMNDYYAFVEIEKQVEIFGWGISKIRLDQVNDVNQGARDVQSLFQGPELYTLLYKNGEVGSLERVESFGEKYAIRGSLFRANFCDMDAVFDYHGFAAKAIEEKTDSISVVLQSEGGLLTKTFFSIFKYLKSICASVDKMLNLESSIMTVQHASTVVTFTFPTPYKGLLEDQPETEELSERAFNRLGNVLSATDADSMCLEGGQDSEKLLSKYERLMDTFGTLSDKSPKIVLATPRKSSPVSFPMDAETTKHKKEASNNAIKQIRENVYPEKTILKCRGILTGIIAEEKGKFCFDDYILGKIEGTVDFALVGQKGFIVKGTQYDAAIEQASLFYKDGTLKKRTYKLLSLNNPVELEKAKQASLFDE